MLLFFKIKTVDFNASENVAFIDPAREGKDFTAISVAGRNFDNLIVSGWAFRKAWYDCLDEFEFAHEFFLLLVLKVTLKFWNDFVLNELLSFLDSFQTIFNFKAL